MANPTYVNGAVVTYDTATNTLVPTTTLALDAEVQNSSLPVTTLLNPQVTGMHLISLYIRLAQAATTSSIMGPVTVGWLCADCGVVLSQVIQMSTVHWGQLLQNGSVSPADVSSIAVTFPQPYTGATAPSVVLTWTATSSPTGHQQFWGIEPIGSSGNWTGFTVYFGGTVTGTYTWSSAGASNGQNTIDASNVLGAGLCGSLIINATAGTPITISIGYSSAGATSMEYAYHAKAVFLGTS